MLRNRRFLHGVGKKFTSYIHSRIGNIQTTESVFLFFGGNYIKLRVKVFIIILAEYLCHGFKIAVPAVTLIICTGNGIETHRRVDVMAFAVFVPCVELDKVLLPAILIVLISRHIFISEPCENFLEIIVRNERISSLCPADIVKAYRRKGKKVKTF